MYCRHSAAIYIMVVKFRNTICSPPPQLSLYRRAALSSNSNGTRSVYSRKNPKSSLYCQISMVLSRLVTYSQYLYLHGRSIFSAKQLHYIVTVLVSHWGLERQVFYIRGIWNRLVCKIFKKKIWMHWSGCLIVSIESRLYTGIYIIFGALMQMIFYNTYSSPMHKAKPNFFT
jgi:hypothetical protein